MVAVMWTALFGMAVVAVDFGYLYTKKRGLQSVADSALKAAMPVYRTQGVNAAQARATQIARLSGYEQGVKRHDGRVLSSPPSAPSSRSRSDERIRPSSAGFSAWSRGASRPPRREW